MTGKAKEYQSTTRWDNRAPQKNLKRGRKRIKVKKITRSGRHHRFKQELGLTETESCDPLASTTSNIPPSRALSTVLKQTCKPIDENHRSFKSRVNDPSTSRPHPNGIQTTAPLYQKALHRRRSRGEELKRSWGPCTRYDSSDLDMKLEFRLFLQIHCARNHYHWKNLHHTI